MATAHAVLRYYQARQRAEFLVERLLALADTTVAVHTASTFTRLLEAAAAGAARIFKSPAVVVAESSDGDCLAAVATGTDAGTVIVPWTVDDRDVPIGATVRVTDPAEWALLDWPAGDTLTVAAPACATTALRSTSWCPPARRPPGRRCSCSWRRT